MKTNLKGMLGKTLIITIIVTLVLSFSNVNYADASNSTTRLSGQTRFETSKAIAENYEQGKVQNIVLSTGNGFADALSASVLAHEKSAPILLVDTTVNGSQDAYDYVSRHLDPTGTVYIIGGTGVINKEFETKLNTLGFNNIVRVAGYDRYETSYQLANSITSASTVVIASGESYPDALSISSFAANKGWPILLTPRDEFPQVMKNFLTEKKPSKVYIIGGTGVISDNVKSQINSILPQASVERLAGQDRFETNAIIAQTFKPSPTTIYVATGYGFADALAGSSLAAKNGDPIMFVDSSASTLPKSIAGYFKQLFANNINPNLVAFGGTSVVPDSLLANANDLMSGIVKVDPATYVSNEEKMKTYGFDLMYDNKSAKSSEYATNAEAIKLALVVIFNVTDAHQFLNGKDESQNENWIQLARNVGMVNDDINVNNYNAGAKYIDAISAFEAGKKFNLKGIPVKDTAVSLKDISNYTQEEQTAVRDMIANGIISPAGNTLNGGSEISKGQLNELVINFAEKYNAIALEGDTINLDPATMPSNADQYAYTLANVDKSIYEFPFDVRFSPGFINPKRLYTYHRDRYPQVKEDSAAFFNAILNVDYRTITEENFREQIKPYMCFKPNDFMIKQYVQHVKDDEIVLEGKSDFKAPIIYSDGFNLRGRIEITFDVKHSKSNVNLLYLDCFDIATKTYNKNSYDFLIDYVFDLAIGYNRAYMSETQFYYMILDKANCGITKAE